MFAKTFTSVLAIAWASAAAAQTTPAQTPQAPSALQQPPAGETQPQGQAATPAIEGSETSNGDIIVTAQRRSERLVDVPISITSVSASAIERAGPESLENLTKAVPGVYLQRQTYGLSPTIRGIGSTLGTTGGEQNVAVYVDGVYQSNPSGNIFDLGSVSSVDVLKGPQGTLFGRNATGGALLIKTLDPSFTRSGRFNVSYERFDQVRSSAYLNVPLTDTLAVNGAVSYRYSRGYLRDNRTGALVNEGRAFTARGKLLFQPVSNLSVILTAAHNDFDDATGSDAQAVQLAGAYLQAGVDAGPVAYDRFHLSHNTQDIVRTSGDEYTAHIKADLDFGTITSISALNKNFLYSVNDLDRTYATIAASVIIARPAPLPPIVVPNAVPTNQSTTLQTSTKSFSQELNFTSPSNRPFTYIAGLYYFHNEGYVPFVLSNTTPLASVLGKGDAYAAYAEATLKLGNFSVIAGGRYSYEDSYSASAVGASAPAPYTRFQNATDKKFTPRLGLRYALSPRSNIYATYSKGFKSGVFASTSATAPRVTPETVNAYEVGFKTSSRMFTLNAAAYYYDYKDTQVNSVISGTNNTIVQQMLNVPKSEIYGLDLDGTVRFSNAFDLRVAYAYTHARYKSFPSAPGYSFTPGATFGLLVASTIVDASGNRMVRAPEHTASATVGYHARLGDHARLDVTASPYYSSRVYFDFPNQLSQAPYFTLDAGATLTLNDTVTFSLYGRNLTDKTYYTSLGTNVLGTGGTFAKPRVYGASFGYKF